MLAFRTTVPGYPRVGIGRAHKKLLEGYWTRALSNEDFAAGMSELRKTQLRTQAECGLDLVPSGDFSLYDHVLDAAIMLGAIPARFGGGERPVDLDRYFAMARGSDGVPPLELTKWFDTNYHYLVPELVERFRVTSNWPLDALRFGREVVGASAKPVVLGPLTFLRLARVRGNELVERIAQLTPLYMEILRELGQEAPPLIQLDEPSLVTDLTSEEFRAFGKCYRALAESGSPILVQTYYGDVAPHLPDLLSLPIAGIGLDLVAGRERNLAALQSLKFPADKLLVVGVVDGRNIWRTDLDVAHGLIARLAEQTAPERVLLSASCPLLHLPETTRSEEGLTPRVIAGLCFARERLVELSLLARAARHGRESVRSEWEAAQSARRRWMSDTARHRAEVQGRVRGLSEGDFSRPPYEQRLLAQRDRIPLPLLPTTTIGSFPQTTELRKARARAASDPSTYAAIIRSEIERIVRLQEDIGLDVLVHGEPERNDMVQFFAEQMHGYVATHEGWVQSYGSRCVRPPILYGDIERRGAMTVTESRFAQSLTRMPVKGMLTGPVTMLQWSFVREDVSHEEVAYQLALAVRDETIDLEQVAHLRVIQIDEPAFREGLPLRRAEWPDYLRWATRAFRLATSGVDPATQLHTHMCYSDFADIVDAIAQLDADVISIEDARSEGAMLETLRRHRYIRQIGPGVYDIHSINVPEVATIVRNLEKTTRCVSPDQVWVNPDCGLKTRTYPQVDAALRNMVAAARRVRASLSRPAPVPGEPSSR